MVPPGSKDSSPGESQEPRKRPLTACLPPRPNITVPDTLSAPEFRMAPGSNSGLGVRTRSFDPARSRATRSSFFSYEIQLFDDAGKPATTHSSGSLYRYLAPRKNVIR